ncbi:hypothetical protein AN639_08680 [Candidatus Epulonipiscium fishelsonii]|uniref:Uncharacterized protein n=1 Tax=Candidatus Epulonipiscium fishelsonii TaxID=77094 RepID=A0ACC8X9Q9_9FIRM|nr:hypothetical protein AN639_08680 [Epulopiscium sp. SCG-B05WGA-EpuloA1]ONI38812.1 hypothetical protein AN396_10020 [Epulopiscium sp. SCG-B11WGA-EpuloA1]ONI47456.1 hypothetical protein AN644_05270 [Epulopiscium sp. SCG-C06WGA-EpuloA1]
MKNNLTMLKLIVLISILMLFGLAIQSIELYKVMDQLNVQINNKNEQIKEKEYLLKSLEEKQSSMESLEYIEQIARDKLGMVKIDDIIFKLE